MRKKSLFSGKIKCIHCNSNFKLKRERSKNKYICSSYDNKKSCIRIPVDEEYLIWLIEKRLGQKISRELIEEYVEQITIEDSHLLEIIIKDQQSILMSQKHLRY